MGLFNAKIAPLAGYSIKGVIWYQGESNTGNAAEYQHTFPAMIKDWRNHWGQSDFPFIFVQLANFLPEQREPVDSQWAQLREAQLKTLALRNTAMVVATDLGEWNDIHPQNKRDVGERLALAARKMAYGERDVTGSGPLFQSMRIEGSKIRISFTDVAGGLIAKDGSGLRHFAICGADSQFVWANAKIQGDEVWVWHSAIEKPLAVRYGWANNPGNANLYNAAGLPASPFRTDEF